MLPAAALALSIATSHAAPEAGEPDAGELIRKLAQPPPATTAFTEVRFSPLLQQPLIVSGELGYSGPQNLERHVTQPYAEHTVIRGESVRVERSGQAPRTFALQRAPELRGLLTGFVALLSGDSEAIAAGFDVRLASDAAHWTLDLVPKDARVKRRVERFTVDGSNEQPHCFSMMASGGGVSVMLLGELASVRLPAQPTLADLQQLCARGLAPA